MRGGILLILTVCLTAAAGFALCKLAGWNAQPHLMIDAATATLAGGVAALIPLSINRNKSHLSVAQAALIGTSLHLLISVAISVLILWMDRPAPAFVYWVSTFYWVTLAVVCGMYVKALRGAPTVQVASHAAPEAASKS